MTHSLPERRVRLLMALVVLAMAALALTAFLNRRGASGRLLLAPMIGLDACVTPSGQTGTGAPIESELLRSCSGPEGSAAALVEATLSGIQPAGSASKRYELGYTLNVPLLKMFKENNGDWVIDKPLVARLVRTLRDSERPAIVYLFSTHFGVNAPIEEALVADPANLSWTAKGPLANGIYYEAPIYNWSLASTGTALTARRVQAAEAVIREICRLEPRHIAKIRGMTLLGELHHLFPDFNAGMGFDTPYLVSDYNDVSKADFRESLKKVFSDIAHLNRTVGTHWTSFDQVEPSSKDVRTTPLRDFSEHIDSFAHGSLPITGWAHVKDATDAAPAMVRIYRNGELIGKAPVSMGRQDVLEARPELGTANTGWRFDMDFKTLAPGLYRIDVLLENGPSDLVHLATRRISIMDRHQQAPKPQPEKVLPASRPADAAVKAHVDVPVDQASFYYNPLVTYWHAFRALQVMHYLQKFSASLDRSCLAETKWYTHQIMPFTNPGWDETKFAADASLKKLTGLNMGVSLYGESTYGNSFSTWLATTPHKNYGVTEFHPLKALDGAQLQAVLDRHAGQGAEFLSFFMEPRWKGQLVPRGHNALSLDPDNSKFGARELYGSVRQLLSQSP